MREIMSQMNSSSWATIMNNNVLKKALGNFTFYFFILSLLSWNNALLMPSKHFWGKCIKINLHSIMQYVQHVVVTNILSPLTTYKMWHDFFFINLDRYIEQLNGTWCHFDSNFKASTWALLRLRTAFERSFFQDSWPW